MTKANRDHPVAMDVATAIDCACGRRVHLGLEQEAIVELARELAFMLDNNSFKPAAKSIVPQQCGAFPADVLGPATGIDELKHEGRVTLEFLEFPTRSSGGPGAAASACGSFNGPLNVSPGAHYALR